MNNKTKKKIFCFGNEYIEHDEIAKELGKNINNPNFEFIMAESPNEILNSNENLIILDVVKGLKKIKIINKIDDLILANSLTCHDLDLAFYLKLMKETGQIKTVTIIGLPYGNNNLNELKIELENILKTI